MCNKSLIILLISLFILFSSINSISAYDYAWEKYYDNYHDFNGTIVDMDNKGNYLIDVKGTTFYAYTPNTYETFYIGDKVTIHGNAYNEKRNMHWMGSEFHAKYDGKRIPTIHMTYGSVIVNGHRESAGNMKLADGFVRGGSSSTTNHASGSMSILNGTIITGSSSDDKTKCTIYVGKEYSGKNIKISVLYSRDGKNLNKGLKVDKKVSSSGEITVYSKDAFAKYPDKAKITIYSHKGKKIDTTIVTLAENSKPQPFDFSSDSKPRKRIKICFKWCKICGVCWRWILG